MNLESRSPGRRIAGRLLAVVLLASSAGADIVIEDRRPGFTDVAVRNETNRAVLNALAAHFGFTPDVHNDVWALERTSFEGAGSAERVLTAFLKGTNYMFSYGPSPTVPSAVHVLPVGSDNVVAIVPVAPPADQAPGPAQPATPTANESGTASVADLLRARAGEAARESDSQSPPGEAEPAASEATQAALAEMTRRIHADVENLAKALKEAGKSTPP